MRENIQHNHMNIWQKDSPRKYAWIIEFEFWGLPLARCYRVLMWRTSRNVVMLWIASMDPPVVCLDAWNQLKWSRTPSATPAAMTSNLKIDFVILRFWIMCECLISSGMMFMKCWNNWFEWIPSQNSIVT